MACHGTGNRVPRVSLICIKPLQQIHRRRSTGWRRSDAAREPHADTRPVPLPGSSSKSTSPCTLSLAAGSFVQNLRGDHAFIAVRRGRKSPVLAFVPGYRIDRGFPGFFSDRSRAVTE